MADIYKIKRKGRAPKLTLLEVVTRGLMSDMKDNKSKFTIKYAEGKGRGVYLAIPLLKKSSFVLEYEGDLISEAEAASREQVYAHNNEGCYIMSFMFKGNKMAIDATRHFDSYTRLLNHSRHPNIKFFRPILVDLNGNSFPRIGAYALRDIKMGEELVFDYGVRDGEIPWLRNKKAGFYSMVDSSTDDEADDIAQSDSRIMMRLSSPNKRVESQPKNAEAADTLSSESNPISTSTQDVQEKSHLSDFTHLKKSRKMGAMFSTLLLDYKSCCGFKFTKVTGNSYIRGLQHIGCPQKILRSLEEGPKKRRNKEEEESACISLSDESLLSKQEHSPSDPPTSKASESLTIESVQSDFSSLNKVLNWLPCIAKVQSLNDGGDCVSSKPEKTVENLNPNQQQESILIEDSSEEENSASLAVVQDFPAAHSEQLNKRSVTKKLSPDVMVISDDESPHTLPCRKFSAFSSVPTPTQIAIIKPYNTPCVSNEVSVYITDSPPSSSGHSGINNAESSRGTENLTVEEINCLEKMFRNYMFTKNYQEDIYGTIEKNWFFFKNITERGVSVEEIRAAVRNIFAVRP